MVDARHPHQRRDDHWTTTIPVQEWAIYGPVLERIRDAQLPYALGGAFALATYTGEWRDTKDLDLYILPADRERFIEMTVACGHRDLFDTLPYDRGWIYRSTKDGYVIDLIWALANYVAQVDEQWLTRGPQVRLGTVTARAVPAEELVWAKLYVFQRSRCDWPDLLNLLYVEGPAIDWEYLFARVGGDRRLLSGLLDVFVWLCPGRAAFFPGWVWPELGISPPVHGGPDIDRDRVRLVESRDWFSPLKRG